MYIRRNYNRPFYGSRRSSNPLIILLLGIIIGGILVLYQTRFDDLRAQALKTVGINPEPTAFPGAHATWGANKFLDGDLEGARNEYMQALEMQPDNIDYLYEYGKVLIELGLTDQASAVGDRAIAAAPNDVRGYALKANALAYSDPQNAIPFANRGRDLDPNFAPLYSAKAVAYTQALRYDLAIENGQLAITKDPMDANTHRAYAVPLAYTGQYRLAIDQLETAIQLAPKLTGAYFELAFWYKYVGSDPTLGSQQDTAMAVVIYETILEINPSREDQAKANLRLCETFATVALADFSKAEPYCLEAIDIKPDYGSAYRELGRMRYNRRNYEGAIDAFETCEALGATDIECWSLRGLAYYWIDECDKSWSVLNEALNRAYAQGEQQSTIDIIETGLYNIVAPELAACPAYKNMPQPTEVLPTSIPPTPIGGL